MSDSATCWACGKACKVTYNPKPNQFCAEHGGEDA